MPRTKIVCTIGPASESPETIRALITDGMNVVRLNFYHGSRQEQERGFMLGIALRDTIPMSNTWSAWQ
jgi:pyruvate kinase